MRQGIVVFLVALFGNFCALADIPAPTWMNANLQGIDAPTSLSGAEQDQCVQIILEEINKRAHLSLHDDDVAPIKMSGWDQSERGFIRGGGFNIRIATTLPTPREKMKHLHPGRFASFMTWLKLGDEPSLHLPKNIDSVQTYFETEDETGTHLDFIAHVDSAYAYLPLGLFVHVFEDVVGADSRNPCPVQGGEDKKED